MNSNTISCQAKNTSDIRWRSTEGGKRSYIVCSLIRRKPLNRVPRGEIWYLMRKSGVAESYVGLVQHMCKGCVTANRCTEGETDGSEVKVGFHQESVLSPFLFAVVMDRLTGEIRQEDPRSLMFADNIVLCSEGTCNLERWQSALERRRMRVSRN